MTEESGIEVEFGVVRSALVSLRPDAEGMALSSARPSHQRPANLPDAIVCHNAGRDWAVACALPLHSYAMAKRGNRISIPLSAKEAISLLFRVKPTADTPRTSPPGQAKEDPAIKRANPEPRKLKNGP